MFKKKKCTSCSDLRCRVKDLEIRNDIADSNSSHNKKLFDALMNHFKLSFENKKEKIEVRTGDFIVVKKKK